MRSDVTVLKVLEVTVQSTELSMYSSTTYYTYDTGGRGGGDSSSVLTVFFVSCGFQLHFKCARLTRYDIQYTVYGALVENTGASGSCPGLQHNTQHADTLLSLLYMSLGRVEYSTIH